MKLLALCISALAVLATAQSPPNPITAPTGGNVVQAGTATTITWTPTTQGTVTLVLRSGSANDLSTGTPIASSIQNSGSFSWTPDASLVAGSDYSIEIIDDSDTKQTNYSPMFSIASSVTSSAGSSVSGTSASTGTSATSLPSSSSASAAASSTSTTTTAPLYTNSTASSTTRTSTVTHLSTASEPSGSNNNAGSAPTSTSESSANIVARCGYGMLTVAIGIGAAFAFA